MKKRIISCLLVVIMLFLFTVPIYADNNEEFISEVALVYEDSVNDARAAIKGTDWKLFEMDLNPDADLLLDDGVYLIYKTTTDPEEAITDLRVMDMYGGFSISNYEREFKKIKPKYNEMAMDVMSAILEFRKHYQSGDEMAKIAYRQMNYYKDMGESGKPMGDFFLEVTDHEALVDILMQGNVYVVSNLISLLAIGTSRSEGTTLSSKIEAVFADQDFVKDDVLYDDAVIIGEELSVLRSKLLRYDALKNESELNEDNMTEEAFVFVSQYSSLAVMLEKINIGTMTLAEYIRKGEWTELDLYRFASALNDGQRALLTLGQFETLLKYSNPSKPIDEINETLATIEENMYDKEGNFLYVDVYLGVDRSVFEGTFAMTDAAQREEALNGETWDTSHAQSYKNSLYYATVASLYTSAALFGSSFVMLIVNEIVDLMMTSAVDDAIFHYSQGKIYFWMHTFPSWTLRVFMSALGFLFLTGGLFATTTWYNYYNPKYSEIPDMMVDAKETDVGVRYIKYNAAKVFGEEHKNADFNAYQGKEWIALYYTKDYSAGNCLTPNFTLSNSDASVARRHRGVSMFGESVAFDLNSHVYKENAPSVYLSVRYSNTKKAAADIPDVVGSIFMYNGFYVLTSVGGVCVGVAGTVLFMRYKKKKNGLPTQNEPQKDN